MAQLETFRGFLSAIHGLTLRETMAMSKYEYLAHLTELATTVAQAKKVPADEIFRTLAALPRDKVAEHLKRMV
jgi:hypothetical protein